MLVNNRVSVKSRDMSAAWRHIDFVLVGLVALASLIGALMVYSATRGKGNGTDFIQKHVIFLTLGACLAAAVASVDYVRYRDWARLVFTLGFLGLVGVLIPGIGSVHKGIRAWFDVGPIQIQPAEFMKVVVIVAVASYVGTRLEGIRLKETVAALALFVVPMGLILLQPDLGTALVYVAIAAGMLAVSGVPARYLIALGLIGILSVTAILTSDALDNYQKARLTTFVNPDDTSTAALTASYNTRQAQAAISLGGMTGSGYLQGQYTSGRSVPEQQTDFIFTVPAEEFGFVGSGLLLAILAAIVWRVWRTAHLARDTVGTLICVGVMCLFAFHIFENVGMNLGIMPVTGIPLPFISYGGSSTLTAFAAIGLVLNVHSRRFT